MNGPAPSSSAAPQSVVDFTARVRTHVQFAFQPIVNAHTGAIYGYEALLRGHERLGFGTIAQVFDYAYAHGILYEVDTALRDMAAAAFAPTGRETGARLFFNLDNRILEAPDFDPDRTAPLFERHGLSASAVCLEISEQHGINMGGAAERMLDSYRNATCKLAIDDFGTGHSGLKLLYQYHPDFIKIDRFFIAEAAGDSKKNFMVATITNLAHVLGIQVIAEGIEDERTFWACKDLGCDLIQGYYVGRPMVGTPPALRSAPVAVETNKRDKRNQQRDQSIIFEQVEFIKPINIHAGMAEVFDAFRRNRHLSFFPVVNDLGEPIGLVHENNLKSYIYSPFGKDLIANRAFGRTLKSFISPCPVADIRAPAEKILTTYTMREHPEGIIIVRDARYVGFLSAASLLRVINEKNLAAARDQNPLSRLPGNGSINDYVAQALSDREGGRILVYFDFDNFKPFNDTYGFRQGDRAILLFSELMQKLLAGSGAFLGHIGGDDYFAGLAGDQVEEALVKVRDLIEAFTIDVESFYSPEDRERGHISARDRQGEVQRFPLLSVSAAVLYVPPGQDRCGADTLVSLISRMKKEAKSSPAKICVASLIPCALPGC